MENKGRVVGQEQLLIKIWGYDFEGNERVVDNHVKKLRKMLGSVGGQIKTVITKGYKLEELYEKETESKEKWNRKIVSK